MILRISTVTFHFQFERFAVGGKYFFVMATPVAAFPGAKWRSSPVGFGATRSRAVGAA
jgi:hypothetical protein